jgi:hypothetical protein
MLPNVRHGPSPLVPHVARLHVRLLSLAHVLVLAGSTNHADWSHDFGKTKGPTCPGTPSPRNCRPPFSVLGVAWNRGAQPESNAAIKAKRRAARIT